MNEYNESFRWFGEPGKSKTKGARFLFSYSSRIEMNIMMILATTTRREINVGLDPYAK